MAKTTRRSPGRAGDFHSTRFPSAHRRSAPGQCQSTHSAQRRRFLGWAKIHRSAQRGLGRPSDALSVRRTSRQPLVPGKQRICAEILQAAPVKCDIRSVDFHLMRDCRTARSPSSESVLEQLNLERLNELRLSTTVTERSDGTNVWNGFEYYFELIESLNCSFLE